MTSSLQERSPAPDGFRLIFIAGWGRSGTTLLDNLLNIHSDVFSTGELASIWRLGILEGYICGCGRRVLECPVWADVLDDLHPGDLAEAALGVASFQRKHLRERHLPFLLRKTPSRRYSGYVELLRRLYQRTAEITGASTLVDSSKTPTDAAAAFHALGSRMVLVHLIRDPRATAFSWARAKPRSDRGVEEPMKRRGTTSSSFRWLLRNAGTELLANKRGLRYLRIQYEDLITGPAPQLKKIFASIGLPAESYAENEEVEFEVNHTVSGNPSRFSQGRVQLRLDSEWKQAMPLSSRTLATAISLPLLRRYGYEIRSK